MGDANYAESERSRKQKTNNSNAISVAAFGTGQVSKLCSAQRSNVTISLRLNSGSETTRVFQLNSAKSDGASAK